MKRSRLNASPAAQKAWKQRTAKELPRKAQKARKRPLRARSDRREAESIMRRELVAQILAERPRCEMRCSPDCTGIAVDVHEPLTRARGGSILDPANTITACRPCHDYVHDHPKEATDLGLLKSSWEKP